MCSSILVYTMAAAWTAPSVVYAYSARLVAEFLDANGITYKAHSSAGGYSLYRHGLRASFDLGDGAFLHMSIQTCPPVAGPAFAETALQSATRSFVECAALDYFPSDPIIRHREPVDLFAHIKTVQETLSGDEGLRERLRAA